VEQPLSRVRLSMLAPILVLLLGGPALGVVPGVPGGQALHAAGAPPSKALPEVAWTTTGVVLGVVSAVLAVLVACTALYADRLPGVLSAAARPVGRALTGLRQLHSGHVGDYVAWLVVGVAALGLLLGLPLR